MVAVDVVGGAIVQCTSLGTVAIDTVESVEMTPWSQTRRCNSHCGVFRKLLSSCITPQSFHKQNLPNMDSFAKAKPNSKIFEPAYQGPMWVRNRKKLR